MRILLFSTILAVTITFALNHLAFAACGGGPTVFVCDTTPPNPDPIGVPQVGNNNDLTVNVLPGASIDTSAANGGNGDAGVDLGNGNNTVTVDNGTVISGEDSAVETGTGNDEVDVNDSTLSGGTSDDGIETDSGDDVVNVVRSTVTADDDGVSTSLGNDTVTVDDSSITGRREGLELSAGDDTAIIRNNSTVIGIESDGIECSQENDIVMIENSTVSGGETSISGGNGDDLITLKTGANITDLIDCGPDFDTIVFAMAVPTGAIDSISSAILSKNPAGDSIIINRLFYEWVDCEELIPELTGGFISPVPTLSQWGLIAMAGVLGIVGFMVMRRRKFVV